jgi:hypothetical protein
VETSTGTESKPTRRAPGLGSGRPGPVRKALQAALEEARAADRMTLEHEVRAVVAVRLADLVDRAARDVTGPAFLKASSDLLEVLDTLPVRTSSRGGDGDDGGGDRGRLLRILDSGPTLGDGTQP